MWKTTSIFPKEFVNKIWLQVGEHGYIYIAEITFENKIFRLKMGPKHFCHIRKILICAK